MAKKTIYTAWEARVYDTWGNAEDGYTVNDSFRLPSNHVTGKHILKLEVTVNNEGTLQQFESAYPSDKQIREIFGIGSRVAIDTEGDDSHIYVNRARDGYPLGELHCESHEALSPIRIKEEWKAEEAELIAEGNRKAGKG